MKIKWIRKNVTIFLDLSVDEIQMSNVPAMGGDLCPGFPRTPARCKNLVSRSQVCKGARVRRERRRPSFRRDQKRVGEITGCRFPFNWQPIVPVGLV